MLKTKFFGQLWVHIQPLSSNWPKAVGFGRITQNSGHHAVQGHSRLPILVEIESP